MKPLVIFYSRSGTTRTVGQAIANSLKCDVEEIIDTANRKGLFGWLRSGRDAMKKKLTVIQPTKFNPADYDVIIMGTPNWGNNYASAIRTYITQNQTKMKNVAFFTTCGGTAFEKIFNELQLTSCKQPIATLGLTQKEVKQNQFIDKVKDFASKIR
jgi:flavodoxin